MTRSINAKTASVTKGMNKKRKISNKPRGQSGTHRLKQLDSNKISNVQDSTTVKKKCWLRRLFKK